MKVLGHVVVGVILGYLLGVVVGTWTAEREAGWLSFLVVDRLVNRYATVGALIGGAIGFFATRD